MSSASRFIVFVMSLVFLLTSVGEFEFSAKKLAHDLNHHEQPYSLVIDHAPSNLFSAELGALSSNDVGANAAELEHQLLHTAGAVQLLTVAMSNISWASASHILASFTRTHSRPVVLLEAPFRPPRATGSN